MLAHTLLRRFVAVFQRDRPLRAHWTPAFCGFLALCLTVAAVTQARAASTLWSGETYAKARLLSAVRATGDLSTIPLGVEIKLDDGWKTYWRSPGDAGLPPRLSWTDSRNLQRAILLYPKPHRLTLLGLQTFGYKHDVVFPVDAAVATPGQPLDLSLKLDVLVCAELCVPRTFHLKLDLPAGPATPDPEAQIIAKARAAVPTSAAVAGLALTSVAEVSDQGRAALEVKATARDGFDAPDVVTEIDPPVSLGAPRLSLSPDRHAATFILPLSEALPVGAKLAGRHAILTVLDGDRAVEDRATIGQGASVVQEAPGPSLTAMIAVALLGGLILNLMPCVLPVLGLKFFSVVSQGGRAAGSVRAGFLATAAGIVTSFLVLAGILIGMRAAGDGIGWGIQFQEPVFITTMAVVVTLFACHMLGLFEIPLPRVMANFASRRSGADRHLAAHFATGAFATLLATPCSAPFLGTAVGFALAGGAVDILAIFLALGIGLAAPYLVVAAVPALASRLPRPGRWMLWLKRSLAIPLLATALWLLLVLHTQVGTTLTLSVGLALIAIALLLVVRLRVPLAARRWLAPATVALALGAIAAPYAVAGVGGHHFQRGSDAIAWQPFDRTGIKSLVAQGKTVFVDVTADWCLTCQANKRLVLDTGALVTRLNAASPMQADWTRPDPGIAAYLASYGRYGIPFNIVYGPGAPSGIVLPELLSPETVSAALDRAAAGTQKHSALLPDDGH